MAIKTIKYNDASDISFYNVSDIISSVRTLINDLTELKNSGGDPTLAIQVKHTLSSPNGYNTSNYFATPALLVYHIIHELGNNNKYSIDTSVLFPLLKEVINLSYDNLDKYFEYTINNNSLSFTHPLSIKELGLISYFNPDKLVSLLKGITHDTKDFYAQQKSYKLANPDLFKFENEEEELLHLRKVRRNIDDIVFYINYWDAPTFSNPHNVIKSEVHRVISLPEFTLLKLLMNGFSASVDQFKFIKNNNYIVESWVDGNQDILLDRIAHFDPLERKYFEHFLFESFEHSTAEHFKYILNKNEKLPVPTFLTFEEFCSTSDKGTETKKSDLNFDFSFENVEYIAYLKKINTAILNKDFQFLEKNLDTFVTEDYDKYRAYSSKSQNSSFINLFEHVNDLDTILFLEKYKIYPFVNNDNNKSYYLNTNSKSLQLNIDYLNYKHDVFAVFPISSIIKSVTDHINNNISNLPELENDQLELEYNKAITPLKTLHQELILPYFPKQYVLLKNLSFSMTKRHQVKAILNVIQPYLNEKSFDYLLNVFLSNVNNHQTILTGLKDFLKTQSYDLSHPKFAASMFGTFTAAVKSKLHKEFKPNLNSEYNNNIAWWTIENFNSHLQHSFKHINFNTQNSKGFTFLDKELYAFNKNNSFHDSSRFSTLISEIYDNNNGYNSRNLAGFTPTLLHASANSFSDTDQTPAFVNLINYVVEKSFPEQVSNNLQTLIDDVSHNNDTQKFPSLESFHEALQDANVAHPASHAFTSNYAPGIELFSPSFKKLISIIDWHESLPILFSKLDEQGKQRFFKNLSLSFLTSAMQDSNHLNNMWEALLSSYDNYDFNMKFSLNKFIQVNSHTFREETFKSLGQIKSLSDQPVISNLVADNIANFSKLYFEHCLPSTLEKAMFLSVIHSNDFVSDFKITPISRISGSGKNMIVSYNIDLPFAKFIDLIANENKKFDFESTDKDFMKHTKFIIGDIDYLFHKYSLASELKEKFKEIDQDKKNITATKKKI